MDDCVCCEASARLCEGLVARGSARCCTDCQHEQVVPVDWPARFRAAAEVADGETQLLLARLAIRLEKYPYGVEAIGRALLGEATK